MTITIQVSKGWVSLTHIMAEQSTCFYQSTQCTHNLLSHHHFITSLEDRSTQGEALQVLVFFFAPIKSKWFLHNYQRTANLKINNRKRENNNQTKVRKERFFTLRDCICLTVLRGLLLTILLEPRNLDKSSTGVLFELFPCVCSLRDRRARGDHVQQVLPLTSVDGG